MLRDLLIIGIMLAKIDKKGRITIPKEFREKLGRIVKISMVDKGLLIEPAENPLNRIKNKVKFNFKNVVESIIELRKIAESKIKEEDEKRWV
jgi:AbrB family looped-hinge helix DNA binding protein